MAIFSPFCITFRISRHVSEDKGLENKVLRLGVYTDRMITDIRIINRSKIAGGFAPVVIIWLIFNMSFGIYVRIIMQRTFSLAFADFEFKESGAL